jgi:vancomycin resistance protein VanJ
VRSTRSSGRLGRTLAGLLVTYAAGLTALSVINLAAPARIGPLALSQIVSPHLFAPIIVILPVMLTLGSRRWQLAVVVAAAVIGALRFGPGLVSLPAARDLGGFDVQVLSWNLETSLGVRPEAVVDQLRASEAGIVALQEVSPAVADAIEADAMIRELFPYRVLRPDDGVLGMALLSRYPISDQEVLTDPPAIRALLDVEGERIVVVAGHPLPARIATVTPLRLPIGFDATERDASITVVRRLLDDAGPAEHQLLLGDFNVTDREPAYRDLAVGLVDAHAEVGQGTGSSWRPARLKHLPLGIVRIDFVFSSPGLRPTSVSTDCTPRGSDHCLIKASLAVLAAD